MVIILNNYGDANSGGVGANIGSSSNVTLNNVKFFSYKKWTDGVNVYSSSNVTINDCFLRTGDDSIAVYGPRQGGGQSFWGNTLDVNVTNSILMPDVAHPINIGTHGDPTSPGEGIVLDNINFSNIDILLHNPQRAGYVRPLTFGGGDGNLITDTTFTDIRIEDVNTNKLFDIGTIWNSWMTGAGRGIKNVYFKNLSYTGTNSSTSDIYGYNASRLTQDITFENLRINGNQILNAASGNISVGNYTNNINFIASGGSVPSPTPFPSVTPINLALNKSASADSVQAGHPVSDGNDVSTTTRWCANDGNTGHWWTVDLGSSMNITAGTQVMWEHGGRVYKYKIETSNDNINWTLKVDKTANTSTDQIQTDNFLATARYVKITVTGLASGTWASFNDFKVLGEQWNLAMGKPVSTDSSQLAYPASNAGDGNETTRWSANDGNTGHWWKVDLGTSMNITNGTQVLWPISGSVYQYKVETSTDNTNWTQVVDKTANTSTVQVQSDYFTATARYVRITVTGLPSGVYAGLSEFKVFGDPINLAIGKTASTDSANATYPVSNGIDGNTGTRWSANDANTGHWYTVDLGRSMYINGGTQVMWEQSGKAYKYTIEISNDNVTWYTKINKSNTSITSQVQNDYFADTARYVRITVTGLESGAWASFYEFKVFGDPSNIALGKTASTDSEQTNNQAWKGNDGKTGTRWCANNGNTGHWWMVDLGSSMNITNGTQMIWEKGGNLYYKYKIETSNDGVNWTLKADKTANTNTDQIQNDSFTDTARYVRITVTGLSNGAWACINEFKVFGQ